MKKGLIFFGKGFLLSFCLLRFRKNCDKKPKKKRQRRIVKRVISVDKELLQSGARFSFEKFHIFSISLCF